jgi:phenylacetate-CoA ligase
MDQEVVKELQASDLSAMVASAAADVPYYRDLPRSGPSSSGPESLAGWPILEKDVIRAVPRCLVSTTVARKTKLIVEHTSGSTGTPLTLYIPRETHRRWYGLMETRWRGWYGLTLRDRWAIFGGQQIVPITRRKPPFWVYNLPMRQLYLSSYHIGAETARSYWNALEKYRPRYIIGYTSALVALAQHPPSGRVPMMHPPSVVLTNAEPLYDHQRNAIARAFGCPVRETYGMSEMVCAASECKSGRLHLWPEAGYVEVLGDDGILRTHGEGELVATGLLNPAMPLIRYRVGDRVDIAPPTEKCPCGRTLPILRSVLGRTDDVIRTPDGRSVGRLDPVFKSDLHIREAQIIQERIDRIVVRVVPAEGFGQLDKELILRGLKERVGEMVECAVVIVDMIPRTSRGKFQAVRSLVGSGEADRNGLDISRPAS